MPPPLHLLTVSLSNPPSIHALSHPIIQTSILESNHPGNYQPSNHLPTNLQTSTHLPNFITFYSSLHPASSTPPTTQPFTHSSTHSSNHKSSHPSIHNLSSLAPFIHHPFITQTSNYPSVSLLPFAYTSCHSHFQTYIHLGLSSSHPHTHLLLDSIKCKKLQ